MKRRTKKPQLRKRPAKGSANLSDAVAKPNRFAQLIFFLAGSGLLLVVLTGAYHYFTGNVALEYVQPVGRAYEFKLTNDSPSDIVIVRFRVIPPDPQDVIYEFTEQVSLPATPDGAVIQPDTYVPAAEFYGLDGRLVSANASITFRVPPSVNLRYLKPNANVIYIEYQIEPMNAILKFSERAINYFGLGSNKYKSKFLVVDNYWIQTQSDSKEEAIRIYCRDNSDPVSDSICTELR